MRAPLSWLKDFVDIAIPLDTLVDRMTMAGLEVGGVEHIGADWQRDKLFVGEVMDVIAHPHADRLVLATVAYGQGDPQTVVIGAPNLKPGDRGQKVAFAVEGAQLRDGYSEAPRFQTLSRTSIRGVESAGMVCSEKELGLSDDHTGVIILDPDLPVGQPLKDALGDIVLEVELTPNLARANCIVGLAREIAALTDQPWRAGPADAAAGPHAAATAYGSVASANAELCARYSASLIENVTIQPSLPWMQRRLQYAGQRPINNIVDITNYVMLETGQPLHAFDYETLQGGVVVRRARRGETMQTLDGVERQLTTDMLLITDDSGPIALAGVMGGVATEVTEDTRHIFLESANFNFVNIRRTSQQLRLHSEAAQRFGRGVDPDLTISALLRASRLMETLGGGTLHPEIADTYPAPPSPKTITLRTAEVTRILGMEFSPADTTRILTSLEFGCTTHHENGDTCLEVAVPSRRLDVSEPADLIEEIARIHGYDAIPTTLIRDVLPPQRSQPHLEGLEQTRDILVGCGLTEILSYSLSSLESINRARTEGPLALAEDYISLANPISQERQVLRQSLLPSLLETLSTNRRYRQRMALFEIGRVYWPQAGEELPLEQRYLGIAVTGPLLPRSWHDADEPPRFGWTHLKGIIDILMQRLDVPQVRFVAATHATLHPARTTALSIGGEPLGIAGGVHPQVCERFDLADQSVAMLELNLDLLLAHRQPRRYQPISRFPAVLEDVALVVDDDLPAQAVEDAICAAGGEWLREVTLFDLYVGEPIPAGKKSLAYALTFQADDRSLTEDEVRVLYRRIQERTAAELGAAMRE
jgi:phenylalanyl-tRNA synthetase beta chain